MLECLYIFIDNYIFRVRVFPLCILFFIMAWSIFLGRMKCMEYTFKVECLDLVLLLAFFVERNFWLLYRCQILFQSSISTDNAWLDSGFYEILGYFELQNLIKILWDMLSILWNVVWRFSHEYVSVSVLYYQSESKRSRTSVCLLYGKLLKGSTVIWRNYRVEWRRP